MRVSSLLAALATAGTALSSAIELPAGVPRNIQEFREKHPYEKRGNDCHRKTYTIRASKNDLDDISDEFVEGLKKANNGGTLYLPANQTFIIGKPLDLTWLNDVHVHWEGEIKFTNDTPYWQENAFTHPFQNSIMFWKWGGNKVKLYGEGVLNGNGQRWWNEFAGLE